MLGTLIADGVRDVRFFGRGEIHPEGRGAGIEIRRSRNVEADGVIVTQIPVGESDSVRISNVKSISSYGWGDGMNVFASSNVSYDGVFCRNSDDCSTVYATRKGFRGGCRNILMENSTLWADVAHPIMIGLHGNVEQPDTIENVTYRNIDILDHCEKQLDYQGCFGISCGDNNLVRDITFDNIRVEDFRQGQLVNIRIFFNKKYCLAPGRGVYNVLFKDIDYRGTRSEMSVIAGYDDSRPVSGITFENLRINGVHIADDMTGKPNGTRPATWPASSLASMSTTLYSSNQSPHPTMKLIFTALALSVALCAHAGAELSISSPDGRNRVTFSKPGRELTYKVERDAAPLILPSRAGSTSTTAFGRWRSASALSPSPTAGWTSSRPTASRSTPPSTPSGHRSTASVPPCATTSTRLHSISAARTRATIASTWRCAPTTRASPSAIFPGASRRHFP